MEKEVTRQDKIDAYLLNQMSSSERIDFESHINSDSELKESIRIQKMIIEELNERESFISLLDQSRQRRIVTRKIWRTLSIAAVFTGLLGFFIIQPTTTSNYSLFNSYSDAEPGRIESVRVGDPLRGNEYVIPGLSIKDSEYAMEGFSLFKNNDYPNATISFQRIAKVKETPEILLYLSISQLKSGQNAEAVWNLEYLVSLKDFKSAELASYYLSLSYLQTGKILKARKLLKVIINGNGEYAGKASAILSKMRWF